MCIRGICAPGLPNPSSPATPTKPLCTLLAERPACTAVMTSVYLLASDLGLHWPPCSLPPCKQPALAGCSAQPRPLPLPAGTCCELVAFARCPAQVKVSGQSHDVCSLCIGHGSQRQCRRDNDTISMSAEGDAIHDCHCRQPLKGPTCGSTSSGKESSSAWPAPPGAASCAVKIWSSSTCKACSMAFTCTQAGSTMFTCKQAGRVCRPLPPVQDHEQWPRPAHQWRKVCCRTME